MSLTLLKHDEKFYRRCDIFAALSLTLLFHAVLLVLFKSPEEQVKRAGYELPEVGVIDLSDESDPEACELLSYIELHDPSLFVLSDKEVGYSYICRQPDLRPSLPAERPVKVVERGSYELPSDVAIKISPRPEGVIEPGLLPVLLSHSGAGVVLDRHYPEIDFSGGYIPSKRYDFSGYEDKIAGIAEIVSCYRVEFSGEDELPRVEVLKSSGDVLLDNAVVVALLGDMDLRKNRKSVTVTVRWKEG